jgi:predicted transglutaminase-like protease
MNIKQSLRTIYEVLSSKIGRFFKGYWPTSDEIGNDKVKSLANRLKAGSYKETFTNILEWQERNMEFWTERHPILTLLERIWVILAVAVIVFLVGGVLVSIFFLTVLNNKIVAFWFLQIVVWSIQNPWLFIGVLGSSTIAILATMISILHYNRKFPWKEVPRGLWNVIWPNISMDFLLKKKLGVCRDYAKITACLLSNIYQNTEVYFVSAPGHVAAGIYIENRLYMLDQRLPILTIDRWSDYRKPKISDRVEIFDPIKTTLREGRPIGSYLQTRIKSEPNIEDLAKRMTELLNKREQPDGKTISLQEPIPILWKKGYILYEENEMTDYSLVRYLEMKISSEQIRKNQIARIELSRDGDDLTFQIRVSQNK